MILAIVLIAGMAGLTGCGVSSTAGSNSATSLTNVQLSQNNFRVIGRISGSANNWYVLGFGGLLSKHLYGEAKNAMLRKADLTGRARAVIDITYDTHVRTILLYSDYTVTCTGTLIEFTEYGLQSTGQVLPEEAPEPVLEFRRRSESQSQPRQRARREVVAEPEEESGTPSYPEQQTSSYQDPIQVEQLPIAERQPVYPSKGTNVFGDTKPFVERNAAVVNKVVTVRITGDSSLPVNGTKSFADYVSRNFNRTAATRCGAEHGIIQVDFDVSGDGRPYNARVLQSVCSALDNNVIYIITEGPLWTTAGNSKAVVEINF